MANNAEQVNATEQKEVKSSEAAQTEEEKEKARNAEIVKCATRAFLDYRRALNSIISPELGVIDDLTVTWLARYGPDGGSAAKTSGTEGPKVKKFGRMHVSMHTKTAPEAETGKQVFNSFTIDSNVSFDHDLHPIVEDQMLAKAAQEEEEKKKKAEPKDEQIQEIITAAAAQNN